MMEQIYAIDILEGDMISFLDPGDDNFELEMVSDIYTLNLNNPNEFCFVYLKLGDGDYMELSPIKMVWRKPDEEILARNLVPGNIYYPVGDGRENSAYVTSLEIKEGWVWVASGMLTRRFTIDEKVMRR